LRVLLKIEGDFSSDRHDSSYDPPEKIKGLNEYFVNTQKINEMGIEIRPITFETVIKSQMVRMAYGLMVNDSVIVASMQEDGLKLLATNDTGFEKVDEILVYSPEDVDL
jgi:predicted nucleic acid-binding protein